MATTYIFLVLKCPAPLVYEACKAQTAITQVSRITHRITASFFLPKCFDSVMSCENSAGELQNLQEWRVGVDVESAVFSLVYSVQCTDD